jgi:hypothetical protein
VEGEVKKGPNLLANCAKVLELDVVEIELVYEVLK